MTITTDEFIRRFLLHVLPRGFHRIRHYGLLAGSARKASLALARRLLEVAADPASDDIAEPDDYRPPCPCCGGHRSEEHTSELQSLMRTSYPVFCLKKTKNISHT